MWSLLDLYLCGVKQALEFLCHVGTRSGADSDWKFANQEWIRIQKKQSPPISATCLQMLTNRNRPITSGVFKGKRGRHLPRASLLGAPLRCCVCKFSLFLTKKLLFTHIMYCKAIISKYSPFNGAPYRNCNVQVLRFQKGPQQQLQFEGNLLTKRPPTTTEMCKYSAFKRH